MNFEQRVKLTEVNSWSIRLLNWLTNMRWQHVEGGVSMFAYRDRAGERGQQAMGGNMSKEVTDYERALVKLRAFEMLDGWGTLQPGTPENPMTLAEHMDRIGKVKQWNLTERMAKADELATWALDPCKTEEAER